MENVPDAVAKSPAEPSGLRPEEDAVDELGQELRNGSGDAYTPSRPDAQSSIRQLPPSAASTPQDQHFPRTESHDITPSTTDSGNILLQLGIPSEPAAPVLRAPPVASDGGVDPDREANLQDSGEDLVDTAQEERGPIRMHMEDATEPLLENQPNFTLHTRSKSTFPRDDEADLPPSVPVLEDAHRQEAPVFGIEADLVASEEGLHQDVEPDASLWDSAGHDKWMETSATKHALPRERPPAPSENEDTSVQPSALSQESLEQPELFPGLKESSDPFAELGSLRKEPETLMTFEAQDGATEEQFPGTSESTTHNASSSRGPDLVHNDETSNFFNNPTDADSASREADMDFMHFTDQILKAGPGEQNLPNKDEAEDKAGDGLDWMKSADASSMGTAPKAGEIVEDRWAEAFGPADNLDESWDAAFAGDEDGFADEPSQDTTANVRYAPSHTSIPNASPQASIPIIPTTNSRYGSSISFTPAPPAPQKLAPAKPMEFFAELPTSNVRSRKAQRPVVAATPSTAPPPMGPAGNRPSSSGSASYTTFQGPGKLDLFPPQPSVPPPVPIISGPPSFQHGDPTPTSRYSPAPSQPVFRSNLASVQAAAPPSIPPPAATSSPPQSLSASFQPRSKSPYAPPPAASGRKSPYAQPPIPSTAKPMVTASVQPRQQMATAPPSTARYGPLSTQPQQSQTPRIQPPSPPSLSSNPPPPSLTNRFAPRTSSPLAQFERPSIDRSSTMPMQDQGPVGQAAHARYHSQGADEQSKGAAPLNPVPAHSSRYSPNSKSPRVTQPPLPSILQGSTSPPQQQYQRETPNSFVPPPRRSSTSSPTRTRHIAPVALPSPERSASVHTTAPPSSGFNSSTRLNHRSQTLPSDQYDFLPPDDETARDDLQRWKGSPIFRWGANGAILTYSPLQIPRYGGGQTAPRIKCMAGEPKIRRAREVIGDQPGLTTFPGPLRSKSKKKEVVAWLATMLEAYRMEEQNLGQNASAHERSRVHERYLLWQCMKVFVENDGLLAGNATVDAAVRQILMPSLDAIRDREDELSTATSEAPHPQDRQAVMRDLKQLLLQGDREKAIWLAVDHRLWSHAMLISSTLSPALWKQVVQEFVRKDVRSADYPNQSLAFLYEVFAGDWEDSVDQLVPVSARSGFQMVSTADRARQPRDAMEGLKKWKETLCLILSNRSAEDEKAILALGKLLQSYGRIEAAHICFLFSNSVTQFGGADDPQTNLALVGFDHQSPDAVVNLDSILLTEVYEFGLSLTVPASAYYVPHMQAYKLRHACTLAEMGHDNEALQYCDAIASAFKSTTRTSPYYHAALASQLEDLQKRLSSSAKDGTSSWKSKASLGKVSSSMGSWFSTFVAGDENDEKAGSGPHSESESGPFANYTGGAGTPSLSRSGSVVDFIGADYSKAQPIPPSNSRYAPRTSHEQEHPPAYSPYSSSPDQKHMEMGSLGSRNSLEGYGSRPGTSGSTTFQRQPSHLSRTQTYEQAAFAARGQDALSSFQHYVPSVPEIPSPAYSGHSGAGGDPAEEASSEPKTNGYPPSNGYTSSHGGYQPSSSYEATEPPASSSGGRIDGNESTQSFSYAPPAFRYDPSAGGSSNSSADAGYNPKAGGGYDPNAGGGYAPPSEPEATSPDLSDSAPMIPNRKSFMDDDDDDDIATRAAALKNASTTTKSANDRAADEAFRKAAEADAARDKVVRRSSSGWFGGMSIWGKKDSTSMPTVHKAKLGEESSFYYDNETKKWVNKKAPSSGRESAAPTPPPPRMGPPTGGSGPPSRNISGIGTPPTSAPQGPPGVAFPPGFKMLPATAASGTQSRSDTPESIPSPSPLPSALKSGGGSSTSLASAVGGPPRPASTMSNASTIEDLIGAPAAKKGGTIKKGKKGQRYVDIMAK